MPEKGKKNLLEDRYFLREMHGSFVTFRLIRALTKPSDEDSNPPETVLAHMTQVPATNMSVFLGMYDFEPHWHSGPEATSDGNMMGGHHEGRHFEISKEQAERFLAKIEKIQ